MIRAGQRARQYFSLENDDAVRHDRSAQYNRKSQEEEEGTAKGGTRATFSE